MTEAGATLGSRLLSTSAKQGQVLMRLPTHTTLNPKPYTLNMCMYI